MVITIVKVNPTEQSTLTLLSDTFNIASYRNSKYTVSYIDNETSGITITTAELTHATMPILKE